MGYKACTFSQMNLLTRFPCICNLELPDISFGDLLWFEQRPSLFLSGVPDYFGRNKISSGGDLSHYSIASLY